MENFLIKSDNKKVKVNDVELVLNFDDSDFLSKWYDISEMLVNFKDNDNNKNYINDISKKFANSIDNMFGEDTCQKIFGCKVPMFLKTYELLEYLSKFVIEYQEKRESELNSKYNSERVGNA